MFIYIILAVSVFISGAASSFIQTWYKKTSAMKNTKGLTGKEVARKILDKNGLKNVKVEPIQGQLTDHYDPKTKTVRLSEGIYDEESVAAISVASHECGHAIQDKDGYLFLRIRSSIVPIVNLASKLGYVAIALGVMSQLLSIVRIGIYAEFIILAFQVITLQVEFNASSRALKKIEEYSMVTSKELSSARSMLTSAALTYVAAVTSTLLEIFRLLLIFRSED